MTKRENLFRVGLLLLVIGIVAALVVFEPTRGKDRPAAERTQSPSRSTTGTVVRSPQEALPDTREGREIHTLPYGVEAMPARSYSSRWRSGSSTSTPAVPSVASESTTVQRPPTHPDELDIGERRPPLCEQKAALDHANINGRDLAEWLQRELSSEFEVRFVPW